MLHMKNPVSDKKLGEFLLDCQKLYIKSKKLSRDIKEMKSARCQRWIKSPDLIGSSERNSGGAALLKGRGI